MPGYEKQPSTVLRIYGYPADVTSWKNQSLHINRPSTHSLPSSKSPPLLELQSRGSFISFVHKPFPPFIICRSDSYASKPPLPNLRSRR